MIRFEKFEPIDYEKLISWIDSEEAMIQFSGKGFTFPMICEQLDKYISVANRLILKVINTKTNEVIGHTDLNNINSQNRNKKTFNFAF